jgi:hypothetical protein
LSVIVFVSGKSKSSNLHSNESTNVPTPRAFEGDVAGTSVCAPGYAAFQEQEKERYYGLFKEAISPSELLIYNSRDNKVKLLRNKKVLLEFEYNVENMKNFYCAFRLAGNDATLIFQSPRNLYEEHFPTPPAQGDNFARPAAN